MLCYYPGLVRSGLFEGTSRVLKALIDVVGATPAQAAANLLAILADTAPTGSPAFFERTRARPLQGNGDRRRGGLAALGDELEARRLHLNGRPTRLIEVRAS